MKMLDKLCYNMRKIFYSLAVVFVVLVGIVGMQESFATECYAPNLERNFVDADIVFSGTVIGIDVFASGIDYKTATVTFMVMETWKGDATDVMDIVANIEPSNCGVNFQSGESYVVYANELDGKFFTNADYGTQSFSRAMNLVGGYERLSAFPEIIAEKEKCLEKRLDLAAENGKFMSPKMQISCEVPKHNVQCNLGLQLIFKSSDNSPACVKTETTEKLIERGWARDLHNHINVSHLFPNRPDYNWTIMDLDVVEGKNAFNDRYGILDIESWRYYDPNTDSQLIVSVAKISNSKNPDDYFEFGLNLSSNLDQYGSELIFDENAVNSIDAEKCTAKKQIHQDGATIYDLLCQKAIFVFKITSTTYETDMTEYYGIDFANQISAKIP